jgi:hypothetical protein
MKRVVFILGASLLIFQFGRSQTPYISPGLGFSWDFNGHFILSPKISAGVLQNGIFYNLTIGRSSSSGANNYPHYYVEVQTGQLTTPSDYKKTQLFYGGGFGFTIPAIDTGAGVSVRASVFTGYLLFLNASILFNERIQTELGGQVVLPIPLKSVDFGPGKE